MDRRRVWTGEEGGLERRVDRRKCGLEEGGLERRVDWIGEWTGEECELMIRGHRRNSYERTGLH